MKSFVPSDIRTGLSSVRINPAAQTMKGAQAEADRLLRSYK
jgi:hypothetical protein